MALGSYQKITRVLPGQPFGDGADGALTVSSDTTQSVANSSCSGSSGSTTLTLGAASSFADGDVILVHQVRGTGVGQWEINRISSGAGTTSLTLEENSNYTYTDSGASQAQVYTVSRYTNVTVDSGKTWGATTWGGNTDGTLLFAANGTFTPTGTMSVNSDGFDGGDGVVTSGEAAIGKQGEGTEGTAGAQSSSNRGNGGGGGATTSNQNGGGGGGNGAAGETAVAEGGDAVGNAELTNLCFGGGGGGGGSTNNVGTTGTGGAGAGAIFIFAKYLSSPNSITATGTAGTARTGSSGGGGGGAGGSGGSIMIQSQEATLGSNAITATGGSGGAGAAVGGAGAVGRIALHYGNAYSGTTSPTLSATKDTDLEGATGSFLLNMI